MNERKVGAKRRTNGRKQASTEGDVVERFRETIEAAPLSMLIVDSSGTILVANAFAQQLLGYAPGELIGAPIEKLVPVRVRGNHPDHRDAFFSIPIRSDPSR